MRDICGGVDKTAGKSVCQSAHHKLVDYGIAGYLLRQSHGSQDDPIHEEPNELLLTEDKCRDALPIPEGCEPPDLNVLQPVVLPPEVTGGIVADGVWYEDLRHKAYFEFKPKCGLPLISPSKRYGAGSVWAQPCQLLFESSFQMSNSGAEYSMTYDPRLRLRSALRMLHQRGRIKWYQDSNHIRTWIENGMRSTAVEYSPQVEWSSHEPPPQTSVSNMVEGPGDEGPGDEGSGSHGVLSGVIDLVGRALRWLSCFLALSDGLEAEAFKLLIKIRTKIRTKVSDQGRGLLLRHEVPGWLVPFLRKGAEDRLCLADVAAIHNRMAEEAARLSAESPETVEPPEMETVSPPEADLWANDCAAWLSAYVLGKVMSDCSLFIGATRVHVVDTGPKLDITTKLERWHVRTWRCNAVPSLNCRTSHALP
ncbi:hypothetical protein GNI_090290 [Gregarina niphandrodes]|uniref:Uncharacterized protein n=1 Tax=Gregarina niphandrodes TaxID=110365 RepID=A0A023B5I5_GRENI|nr:hypothetical protein GNI_090290 [Gregarina niphandrodes]EZG60553.1 hypothetical protein GNI_090290 [Gregarina niphandrodes]|eukprot:XP_011130825.1 hypothetical protein GNI_090290 [Gregarina niphandrodes]